MVDKVTWQKAGHVAKPGRYMFTFGWLTVTAEDLRIWEQFPHAAFTLVRLPQPNSGSDIMADEFHLGAFEIPLEGTRASAPASHGEA